MKKIAALMLVLVLTLCMLAGCRSMSQDETSNPSTQATTAPTAAPTTAPTAAPTTAPTAAPATTMPSGSSGAATDGDGIIGDGKNAGRNMMIG